MSVQRTINLDRELSSNARRGRRRWWTGRRATSFVGVAAALALTAACAGTPEPPSKPTVQTAATQAVGAAQSAGGTAVAGASPAAATAVAAASPAAATAQAAAAPAAATVQAGAPGAGATAVSVVGTAIGAIPALGSPSPSPSPAALAPAMGTSPVRIADASLSDATPWLTIQNDGGTPVDLGGWRLQVGGASAELPDDTIVEAGSALTVHAGEGMSSEDEVYLGDAGEVLASMALPGTPVRLTDGNGQVVTEVTVPRF